MFQLESEGRKYPSHWGRVSLSVTLRPSMDWARPTTLGRATCFTKPTA